MSMFTNSIQSNYTNITIPTPRVVSKHPDTILNSILSSKKDNSGSTLYSTSLLDNSNNCTMEHSKNMNDELKHHEESDDMYYYFNKAENTSLNMYNEPQSIFTGEDLRGTNQMNAICKASTVYETKTLLYSGADINECRNSYKSTPLHLSQCLEQTRLLIDLKANVHARDIEGKMPLHYSNAAKSTLLIAAGASVHSKDDRGRTPLHYSNNPVKILLLLNNGANINARDDDLSPPLHLVNSSVVNIFLDLGADKYLTNRSGYARDFSCPPYNNFYLMPVSDSC